MLAGVLALGAFVGPAGSDEISETREEAARLADRIEELRHQAEVDTERFLDAQLAREELEADIAEAEDRAAASRDELTEVSDATRDAAVATYVRTGSQPNALFGAVDANDVTVRQGYVDVVGRGNDDLIDAYRGAERRASGDARALDDLLTEAEAAEAEADQARRDTEDRIAELEALEQEITGRLRDLVEAEQRRRAEEEARLAAEAQAAAEAAAEAPADVDDEPAAPPADDNDTDDSDADDAGDSTPAPTTSTPPPTTPSEPSTPAGPPPPVTPGGAATGAAGAVAAAHGVLGTPYRWGGESPSQGFDCSGLIKWAYGQAGRSLPHSSGALYSMSRKIPVAQLQPGDLVFYNSPVSHVGLYIGGGQMIHAPHTGSVVQIQSIYYWSALVGGGRI